MSLWNSRFKKSFDKGALKFSSSVVVDGKLYNEDIDGSKAHVKMLMKQKIVSANDGIAILKALEEIRKEIKSGKLKLDWQKEDIHSIIEERLVDKIGERGKRLHTARSRNDQVALDERLYIRKEVDSIIKLTKIFQRTLLKQAQQHKDTIISGYTHLQRAQPLLFAHHLIAYVSMLERDVDRLNDCKKRANNSPLGAAALAGTSLPIDRQYTAKLLDMNGVIINSIDAVSDRDVLIELISACATIMMHLSRFSEEIVLWSSQEFSFALIDDSFATGSSLMPQKKNPDIAELIRGKVGRVYGSLFAILTIMKSLPLAYNRDMQEDKVHLLEAVDTTKDCLNMATELLKKIRFDKKRFEKELDGNLLLATDLVDYLVGKQVPFRKAHQIIGEIVAVCVDQNKKLNELSIAQYKQFSTKFEEEIFTLLKSKTSVNNKLSQGSTSPVEVEKQILFWKKALK
ncbi:MAG: argininosuccinate lyase [Ignavibacteria bacterium]|nr:MAG: argininosuccinate lyase [Ignavibacteria bacterium]KAF0160785.1 MAG: argininosuccinate lyase [Ignavibacteria bacterium]